MTRMELFNAWRNDQIRNTAIVDGGYRAWLHQVAFPTVATRMLGPKTAKRIFG